MTESNNNLAIVEQLNENDINMLRNGALAIKNKDSEIKDFKKQKKNFLSNINLNIKNLENERKIAEEAIIPIMNKGSIDELNISTGKIKYIEKEKKESLTKNKLNNLLESFFMNDDNLNNLLNIEGVNNIEISRKRTKFLLDYFENNLNKKKVIQLKSEFTLKQ